MAISPRLLIEVNSKVTLIIGTLLNCLLICLVRGRTPKEMQIYSKLILQVCFSDLANLIVADLVQPLVFISNGLVTAINAGIAGKLPYPWNVLSYHVWIYFAYFAMVGVVVQFAYRYLVLCKDFNGERANRMYILMVAGVAVYEFCLMGFLFSISLPAADDIIEDPSVLNILGHRNRSEIYENEEEIPSELRLSVRGDNRNVLWLLWHVLFAFLPIAGYGFVVYSGQKMVKFMRVNSKNPKPLESANVHELNRQMTMNLLIQACIPLVGAICWSSCVFVCVFGRWMDTSWFNAFSTATTTPIQSWISVLNPLVTILTVMPYRRAIFRGRLCGFGAYIIEPLPSIGASNGT